jgi:hypothetical protein
MSKKVKKIPLFKDLTEEARFWDTHDVTDYLDEMGFEDVNFLPQQPKDEILTIRLEKKLKNLLVKKAKRIGINPSSLTRAWIVEKFLEENKKKYD